MVRRWKSIKKSLDRPWAAYTFAICCGVVLFLFLSHLSIIWTILKAAYHWTAPVIAGIIIAYVIDPLVRFWENSVFGKMKKRRAARALGVVITVAIIVLFIVFLLVALIPQIIDSITMFIENLSGYAEGLNNMLGSLQEFAAQHNVDISNLTSSAGDLISSITDSLPQSINGILNTTISYGTDIFNGVISCIIAIYILMDKYRLMNGMKRLWKAIVNEQSYQKTNSFLGRCNAIMVRYIIVDLLDGLIIGVSNAVFMLIAGYPYVPLISVIVGVTNLVPTFGPILGGAIGALILLFINPWYALVFLIFTFALQTCDGYILKPKLFGTQLGVPSIWILISIIVFGRIWGIAGILLAIPIAAILDFIYQDEFLPWLEARKKKSTAAAAAVSDDESSVED